jgi:hypothetical protein
MKFAFHSLLFFISETSTPKSCASFRLSTSTQQPSATPCGQTTCRR